MSDHENRDSFDQLIDAALTNYADPGPDIEARVLTGIEQACRRRRVRGWLVWGSGLALAASVLLLFVSNMRVQHSRPLIEQGRHPLTTTAAAPVATQPTSARSTSVPRFHRAGITAHPRTPPTPKLPVFPSPAPLSAEEIALLHLATQTTPEERRELLDAREKTAEPLHIASISIPPIEPPAEGKE